ncbi:MAG: hypothetical protein HY788_08150 [Deltaproteobacteria bacterium]|nr:hypothetical protein [Deltaproteobacteria bacterium]
MTEDQARRAYADHRALKGREVRSISPERLKGGSWLFVEVEEATESGSYIGVVVREDGGVFKFLGALGKVFRRWRNKLGAPKSSERFLGSTAFGCYQAFDHGFAVWEGAEDLGFPLFESLNPLKRQMCIVAFFDLRGFTSWSKDATPEDVQLAIEALEASIHEGFPRESSAPWKKLFLKGTGDGVMTVSQADWYEGTVPDQPMIEPARGHGRKFLHACELAVSAGRERLEQSGFPLAIGCGIASGELDRVFLFGRLDFIGPAANEAAKLQQHAWNEICVTPGFGKLLNQDGMNLNAEWVLATKGWRLRPPEVKPSIY